MPLGEIIFGQCPYCFGSLTAGHNCLQSNYKPTYGKVELPPLTEADVRRIIREELERAKSTVDAAP